MEAYTTKNGYCLRLFKDEKVNESLKEFTLKNGIPSGFISGLGALKNSELGFYHLSQKHYDRKIFAPEMELISLTGNISWLKEDEPIIHTHVALGDPEFRVFGGHLFEAEVAVTVEIFIHSFSDKIYRKMDESIGLNLMCLSSCPNPKPH